MRTARMSAVPFFCLVFAGCLFAASGEGAPGGAGRIRVVDCGHPQADDAKFGYAAVPFKTAAKACEVAEPGETVVLYGGTYREAIRVKKDGVAIRAASWRRTDANGTVKVGVGGTVLAISSSREIRMTFQEKVVVSGGDLVAGWKREAGGGWSAPLAAAPKKLLRDGTPWTDFTYDAGAKRIVVKGADPRLHTIETVVREHGFDLTGRKDVKVEGVEVVNTLGEVTPGAAK